MPNPELFGGAESLNESHSVNINLERQSRGARRSRLFSFVAKRDICLC